MELVRELAVVVSFEPVGVVKSSDDCADTFANGVAFFLSR
jgi:hypothetical protein